MNTLTKTLLALFLFSMSANVDVRAMEQQQPVLTQEQQAILQILLQNPEALQQAQQIQPQLTPPEVIQTIMQNLQAIQQHLQQQPQAENAQQVLNEIALALPIQLHAAQQVPALQQLAQQAIQQPAQQA